MSDDILARIAHYKREEVAEAKRRTPPSRMEAEARAAGQPRGFLAALRQPGPEGSLALIAEVKKASPSRGMHSRRLRPGGRRRVLRGRWGRLPVGLDGRSELPRQRGRSPRRPRRDRPARFA